MMRMDSFGALLHALPAEDEERELLRLDVLGQFSSSFPDVRIFFSAADPNNSITRTILLMSKEMSHLLHFLERLHQYWVWKQGLILFLFGPGELLSATNSVRHELIAPDSASVSYLSDCIYIAENFPLGSELIELPKEVTTIGGEKFFQVPIDVFFAKFSLSEERFESEETVDARIFHDPDEIPEFLLRGLIGALSNLHQSICGTDLSNKHEPHEFYVGGRS
jgi:hypothetical protein